MMVHDWKALRGVEKLMQRGMVEYLVRLHWPVLHVEVPDLDGQVVSGHHVASAVAELDV